MRVLFVSQRLPPDHVSGAPLQALALARALAREGVEVTILTARFSPGQPAGALDLDGARVHRLRTRPGSRISYAMHAAAFVRRSSFDLIHGHALSASSLAAAAAASVPVLLKPSLGGPSGDLAKIQRSPLAPILGRVLERADRFAIVEPGIGAELSAAGIPAEKLLAAKNGVDLERFRPEGPRANLDIEGPIVLFVGRPASRKRLDLLMQAWLQIHRHRPDAALVLAGPDHAPRIEGVRALGLRTDVDALMRTARVLVLPSSREGLPNVLLEAIATGLPAVITGALAPPDLAAAALAVAATPEAIATAVLDALERPRPGVPASIRNYGIDAVAREYAAVYLEMMR